MATTTPNLYNCQSAKMFDEKSKSDHIVNITTPVIFASVQGLHLRKFNKKMSCKQNVNYTFQLCDLTDHQTQILGHSPSPSTLQQNNHAFGVTDHQTTSQPRNSRDNKKAWKNVRFSSLPADNTNSSTFIY